MNKKEKKLKELLPATIMGVLSIIPVGLYLLTILYIFIEKYIRKQPFSEIGFGVKGFCENLRKYWWIILLPVVTGIFSFFLSKLIVPEYFNHIIERTKSTLDFDKLPILMIQILILTLTEEICFRAFLQRKFSICINPKVAIIITSIIFAIGHFSMGSPIVVIYDLAWIFIDSLILGMLFYKTKSVYLCWISHFATNACGVLVLFAI
jgi:membrane protease YdiL (CAAX protease family)